MVERAESCGLTFRDDAYRRPVDGAPERFDGPTIPVDPNPGGKPHDARRWVYRVLRPYYRPVGAKGHRTESVARSVVVRHKHPGQRYAPRELVAYLKGGPRTTEVPTTWPSKGTGGCPEADRPAAVVPESRRGEDTVAPTPRPRLA